MGRTTVQLLLAWLALCGPLGAVLYLITTFLFAFSGCQARMVPIVNGGVWVVNLAALVVGGVALARTRSLRPAVRALLVGAVVAWLVAILVYWLVSFRLGAASPGRAR